MEHESMFIICLGVIGLAYFIYYNDYRRIERYYYQHDRKLFVLLEVSMLIVVASILFNVRHIVMEFLMKWQAKLLKAMKRRM